MARCVALGPQLEDKDRGSPGSGFIPGKSKYRVIFIGEPRAAYVPGDNYNPWTQMEYMLMDMPKDIAQWFRVHFPNHVLDPRPKPTKAEKNKLDADQEERLLMFEWCLLLWSLMSSSVEFEISVVGYEQFRCCLTSPSHTTDPLWLSLCLADVVLGGLHLEIDFQLAEFDITADQFPVYVHSILELSRLTCVFPPPQELLAFGNKVYHEANLDALATYKTFTFRPASRWIDPDGPIPEPSEGVIKRGYSSANNNVHLPGSRKAPIQRKGDVYRECWLWQEFNPLLVNPCFGEVRIYMVAGEVMYAIRTIPVRKQELSWKLVTGVVPFDFLSSGRFSRTKDIFDPRHPGVNRLDLARGLKDLYDFAKTTLKALIVMEENQLKCTSSLNLFARVDIGVYEFETNQFCWYVNEVTRGMGMTAMFGQCQPGELMNLFAEMSRVFPWYIDHASPNMVMTADEDMVERMRGMSL